MLLVLDSIPNWDKTQQLCDRVISGNPFLVAYRPDQYKTQKICNKAVYDSITVLKPIPNWFVTSKMIKGRFSTLHADENKFYFN